MHKTLRMTWATNIQVIEKENCNIPSISHSFCTSRRKQFHLKRLVVAHLLLSSWTSSLWLIGSSDLRGLAHCYSPWPDPSQGGVCILRGHIRITLQQQTPRQCVQTGWVCKEQEQTMSAFCLKVGRFRTIKLPAQLWIQQTSQVVVFLQPWGCKNGILVFLKWWRKKRGDFFFLIDLSLNWPLHG